MRQKRMQPHEGLTKAPPGFDGKTSWFACEDALDDWCDITALESEKWASLQATD